MTEHDKDNYTPTMDEKRMVDQMAAPILAENKIRKRFLGRRNRSVHLRMNRPSKLKAMEQGAEFINAVLARAGV